MIAYRQNVRRYRYQGLIQGQRIRIKSSLAGKGIVVVVRVMQGMTEWWILGDKKG